MNSYIIIPIVALFCYLFLFLAFLAAKKTKVIKSFMLVLLIMILWTGGSLCMRMQLWPSVKFWFDVSLWGIWLLPVAFYNYIFEFTGLVQRRRRIWFTLSIACSLANTIWGCFLKYPEVVNGLDGRVSFVYHMTWPVGIMFLLCAAIVADIFLGLWRFCKEHEEGKKQLNPIAFGILALFIGNIAITLPIFKGIPLDIFAGIVNAFCMFYALYRRRLFRLTLLVSRSNCYLISTGLAVLLFARGLTELENFVRKYLFDSDQYLLLTVSIVFTLATFLIYFLMKKVIDILFIKEENARAENLKNFSRDISKTLRVEEILEQIIGVVHKTIQVDKVYICMLDSKKERYEIVCSTSPLDEKNVTFNLDNPMVHYMLTRDGCLMMRDFRRTLAYKSMWEEEKKCLADLRVECFVPLKDGNNLVGFLMLPGKHKGGAFTYDDISFLSSVDSIGSIALKNSRLYEKAYYEARTDELTGLLNRKYFYEVLQREYEKNKEKSLALIIFNIDDFKLYNQLYGNKEGDQALRRVAKIIQTTVGDNGYVARYSGKEFAVILPLYDVLAAKNLAENIRKQILNMNKNAKDYSMKALTVSGGVCSIPYSASNPKELIDNADMAVYHIKRNGKNGIMVYSVGQQARVYQQEDKASKKRIYSEYAPTIYALTAAIDTKDHYTFSHSENVAYYATELAYLLGMNEDFVEMLREAALLHDVGKIGIPEHILNKPGKLTDEEFAVMKTHVENSIGIIRHLPSLDYVIPAVIGHHERYDGKGYPRRISGEDIPLSARILCVADSFDAMVSKRSYKEAFGVDRALSILEQESGMQFDPHITPIFVEAIRNGKVKPQLDREVPSGFL